MENPLDDDAARANIIATSMVTGTCFIIVAMVLIMCCTYIVRQFGVEL